MLRYRINLKFENRELVYLPAPVISSRPHPHHARSASHSTSGSAAKSARSKLGSGLPSSHKPPTNSTEQRIKRSASGPFQNRIPAKSDSALSLTSANFFATSSGSTASRGVSRTKHTELAVSESQLVLRSPYLSGSSPSEQPPDLVGLTIGPVDSHNPVDEAKASDLVDEVMTQDPVDEVGDHASVTEQAVERSLDRFLEVAKYCAVAAPARPKITNHQFYVNMQAPSRLSLLEVDGSKKFEDRFRAVRRGLETRNDDSLKWLPLDHGTWMKWSTKSASWEKLPEETRGVLGDQPFKGLNTIHERARRG